MADRLIPYDISFNILEQLGPTALLLGRVTIVRPELRPVFMAPYLPIRRPYQPDGFPLSMATRLSIMHDKIAWHMNRAWSLNLSVDCLYGRTQAQ